MSESPRSEAQMSVAPVRVILAEDEAIIRLDLKEILVSAGYLVVGETGRGDEVLELVAQHQPDLAILDVKMPGMDGVRVAREITSRHKVAVLILTAFSQRDLIEEARQAGVAAYLIKPFLPSELLPAIEAVLAKCREQWAIDAEVEGDGPATTVNTDGPIQAFDPSNNIAEDKIQTRKLVEEAKQILMDRFDMSEEDAFLFIQRTAMGNRKKMRQIAQDVVSGQLTP